TRMQTRVLICCQGRREDERYGLKTVLSRSHSKAPGSAGDTYHVEKEPPCPDLSDHPCLHHALLCEIAVLGFVKYAVGFKESLPRADGMTSSERRLVLRT